MLKHWDDRASEANNILAENDRKRFKSVLYVKQQLKDSCLFALSQIK